MAVTTAAVVGIGSGLASAGMSFSQAAQQKRASSKAIAEQKKLQASARQRAEKNFYQGLNVPLDAYGEQFRQNTANQQQTIQALQEGDQRNLQGGIGALTAAGAAANEQTRIGLGEALYENRKMKADAQNTINQDLKSMDMGQAADQAAMARDADQARVAAINSGISGIGTAASSLASLAPLYGKTGGMKRAETISDGLTMQNITDAAGGELSNAQIKNVLRKQNFTGKETRGFLRNKFEDFDYSIFNNMYTPPQK
ncbi:MAG: hypothetical protein CMJ25_20700 [Phycisphaerae bacterium]|nr:hypothetical protein [Phycisphaerae bacterium]|tara:strand:+ start:9350 stop:10117 length:768 start_codon:yes stop_codon:yes gene_type:complete